MLEVLNIYHIDHPAKSRIMEKPTADPSFAMSSGYGESKWIAEQLFFHVATEYGLKATIVRVGQLCGDTKTGGWGTQEWVPAMVSLCQTLRSVPSRNEVSSGSVLDYHHFLCTYLDIETISWISVDIAATILLDIVKVAKDELVMHLLSPIPVSWETTFRVIAQQIQVPLIPYDEWLESLEIVSKDETTKASSAMALLPFFRQAQFGEHLTIDVSKTLRVSPTLAQLKALGEEDIRASVGFWIKIGFLEERGLLGP